MTFLNPLLLFGLAAAAIPILIHLLNLRRLRTIEFSTLQFLKELQKTKMRRVKIRQWLLLLLRTLLVVALVLAFSRPALKGSLAGTIGTRARTTMVILLDDTPSMSVRTNRGVAFNLAKQSALALLPLFKDDDVAYLVKVSEVRHRKGYTPLTTGESMRKAIEQSVVSQVTVPYGEALRVTAGILSESKNLNHEVYVITDLQATQFALLSVRPDTSGLFARRVRMFLMNIGEEQSNAGVTSTSVISRILSTGKPVQIRADVHNFSRNPLKGLVMSLYLDGTRQVQQLLDIAAFSSRSVELSAVPRSTGNLHGYVQIDDDILDSDNRRYFVVHVPRRIPVLLAGDVEADARLPFLALRTATDSAGTGLFDIQTVLPSQLSIVDVRRYAVVVLCGFQRFSPSTSELLARFVRSGGGLIIFPGIQSDFTSYNTDLFSTLGIPPVSPPQDEGPRSDKFLTFGKIDNAHPLFGGLFERQGSGQPQEPRIESPRVFSSIVPQTGESGHTIIGLTTGGGFLTEYRTGAGHVLLFSVEGGLTGSDFPVKGIFVPLLHRSIMYLAAETDSSETYQTGDNAHIGIRTAQAEHEAYSLHAPSGLDQRTVPRIAPATGIAYFDFTSLADAGIYELRSTRPGGATDNGGKEEILKAFAVNIAPSESDLRQVSPVQLQTFWSSLAIEQDQITTVGGTGTVDTEVLESRFGVELWKHFLILAIACALGEMLVGREPGKATSSSTEE
ncbi:MAG: BatA domain-containing protein [Ignavibacteria bacterium]|nr:BatA domain-containing protein [Ignavibacteria bacterium]